MDNEQDALEHHVRTLDPHRGESQAATEGEKVAAERGFHLSGEIE
jgi:hypothetical protein